MQYSVRNTSLRKTAVVDVCIVPDVQYTLSYALT